MRKQGKETGINSPKSIRRFALLAVVVAVFSLGATAAAISLRASQANNSSIQQTSELPKTITDTTSTRRAATQQLPLDAHTGQIKPLTRDEAEKLAAGIKQLVNQSGEGLKSIRHADGSISMNLEGHFQNIVVAKKDENGNVSHSCLDNRESAAAFFGIDPKLVGLQRDPASQTSDSPAQLKGKDQ